MNTQPFWARPADLKRYWKVLSKSNTFHSFFTNFGGSVFMLVTKKVFLRFTSKMFSVVPNSFDRTCTLWRGHSRNEPRNLPNYVFWRYSIDFFRVFLVNFFQNFWSLDAPWPPTMARSQKYFSSTRVFFKHETYLKNFLFGSKTIYFLTKIHNKPCRKGFNRKYFVSDDF